VLLETLQSLPSADRAAQGIPAGQEAQWVEAQVAQMGTEWFRQFVTMDPRPALQQVRVPVLALFGELDLQVPPRENVPAMRAALGNNPDATVLELSGLNHLFQHATTGSPAEYMQIEETFAPVAMERVASWIRQRFGPAAGKLLQRGEAAIVHEAAADRDVAQRRHLEAAVAGAGIRE
jgi:fermentation-respiration switch protein FrsA (DUF1100 family)